MTTIQEQIFGYKLVFKTLSNNIDYIIDELGGFVGKKLYTRKGDMVKACKITMPNNIRITKGVQSLAVECNLTITHPANDIYRYERRVQYSHTLYIGNFSMTDSNVLDTLLTKGECHDLLAEYLDVDEGEVLTAVANMRELFTKIQDLEKKIPSYVESTKVYVKGLFP